MADKQLDGLLKDLESQGFTIERRTRGLFAYSPDKTKAPVAIHLTPSDHRSWLNMLSQLKRAGYIRKRK